MHASCGPDSLGFVHDSAVLLCKQPVIHCGSRVKILTRVIQINVLMPVCRVQQMAGTPYAQKETFMGDVHLLCSNLCIDEFDKGMIANQLRNAGVLEAIRVSRVGYSQCFGHKVFVDRYHVIDVNNSGSIESLVNSIIAMVKLMMVKGKTYTDNTLEVNWKEK